MAAAFDPNNPAESVPAMANLCQILDIGLNGDDVGTDHKELGFFIIVCKLGKPGQRNAFASSINNDDAVRMLRETADYLEARGMVHEPGQGIH